MKYLLLLLVLITTSCNPLPKKDSHPELPFLEDLVKDETKFIKIIDMNDISTIDFLNDDRILLKPNNSNLPFKIVDVNNNVVIESVYDWKLPFYVDKAGNLYFNKKRYNYPDYKTATNFKNIVFKDSIDQKSTQLGTKFPDSVKFKMLDEYEVSLLKPYGLAPCEYQIVHTERCDVFEIKNDVLIVRQVELYKNDFVKPAADLEKFDKDILIRWNNGKLPSPVYLAYYQINGLKFKTEDTTFPKMIKLKGQAYLFSYNLGLFLIK